MELGIIEEKIRHKMESRGIDSAAIKAFLAMLRRTSRERTGYVPLDSVETPDRNLLLDAAGDPEPFSDLHAGGEELLDKVAVIKLNGGRATTMGSRVPKGVLLAKNGRSYLEIIISQMTAMRKRWGVQVPLVLMNSFFTHDLTMEIVKRFDFPVLTFIQNQVPRLVERSLMPLETGTEEDWVPPGHGDVYGSLMRTGLLRELMGRGCRWAFISNLDNLAAYPDPGIVGLLDRERIEFLLEVTDRTRADRKGGTLIARNGHLDLLEIAQVDPTDREEFMDIHRFPVFNTNNVWVDLKALEKALEEDRLTLPIIRNGKRISGTPVIQIETAMGAAIGSFDRSRGLRVGRERFFPTKKVSDLFVLQTDVCILDSMDRLRRNPARPASMPQMPRVFFDEEFAESPDQLRDRFDDPSTVSLVAARSLEVVGQVHFGRNVRIEGDVRIESSPGTMYRVEDGAVLRDGRYSETPMTLSVSTNVEKVSDGL
jgi:UTP--glucose-1-phosphate uridylyltransferase